MQVEDIISIVKKVVLEQLKTIYLIKNICIFHLKYIYFSLEKKYIFMHSYKNNHEIRIKDNIFIIKKQHMNG